MTNFPWVRGKIDCRIPSFDFAISLPSSPPGVLDAGPGVNAITCQHPSLLKVERIVLRLFPSDFFLKMLAQQIRTSNVVKPITHVQSLAAVQTLLKASLGAITFLRSVRI